MTVWIALLRAVNVGGTGKIKMDRLRAAAEGAGFANVRSYIASGNLVFGSDADEGAVREALRQAMVQEFGDAPEFVLRERGQITDLLSVNPYKDAPGNRVIAILTDGDINTHDVRHQSDEELTTTDGALFVHYPSGQGRSKLVIPAAANGTGRNINTLTKLAQMATDTA